MADAAELAVIVLLTIAGWIVAGYVTLQGVRRAHDLEERSKIQREDRTRVFEPLRREMAGIEERAYTIEKGERVLWSRIHASEDYTRVLSSGLLMDGRHDRLREDIDELHRLEAEYQAQDLAFYRARKAAIEEMLGGAKALAKPDRAKDRAARGQGAWVSREEFLDFHREDGELHGALSADDAERWVRRLRGMWQELSTDPRVLFESATDKVRDAREAFRKAARDLLEHATRIRVGLDDATREEREYIRGPP